MNRVLVWRKINGTHVVAEEVDHQSFYHLSFLSEASVHLGPVEAAGNLLRACSLDGTELRCGAVPLVL